MLSEKCFVVFYVFSFPLGVYVGTLNLIASIPGPSSLTLFINLCFIYTICYEGDALNYIYRVRSEFR